MGRTILTLDEADLERELLRKTVGLLTDDRRACADCGRTPLVGETIHRYDDGVVVCELCRPLRREDPKRSERVRHDASGQTVRVQRRTP